jgi:hypothetical protein
MGLDDLVKRYKDMDASELRLRLVALETENLILKAHLDSVKFERNKLLRKVADIDLSKDDRIVQQSNLSPPPKLVPRP